MFMPKCTPQSPMVLHDSQGIGFPWVIRLDPDLIRQLHVPSRIIPDAAIVIEH
ncbi:hypothetical protein DPMN_064694 [Dreissena polymorpha]|uniref:Uncharacterized protein n=1 Tax=Dreissena polymorpha TaxID=45954 RepID=A0A9D4HMD6_DREPO|nr:hypothetical protein DPMN_064694 [Dreissena polymorpha]